jgi:hypothetical protein
MPPSSKYGFNEPQFETGWHSGQAPDSFRIWEVLTSVMVFISDSRQMTD